MTATIKMASDVSRVRATVKILSCAQAYRPRSKGAIQPFWSYCKMYTIVMSSSFQSQMSFPHCFYIFNWHWTHLFVVSIEQHCQFVHYHTHFLRKNQLTAQKCVVGHCFSIITCWRWNISPWKRKCPIFVHSLILRVRAYKAKIVYVFSAFWFTITFGEFFVIVSRANIDTYWHITYTRLE